MLRTILEISSGQLKEVVLSELDDDEIENSSEIIERQNTLADLPIPEYTCELLK